MPEAVKVWRDTQDLYRCQRVHHTIIETYRQDFGKYAKQHQLKHIEVIFDNIPALLGQKIKYSNISKVYQVRDLSPCLDLLEKAHIVHKVSHTSSPTPPIRAGINIKHFKCIFIDVALTQTVLSLELGDWILFPEKCLSNKGAIIEAFVGQELLAYANPEKKNYLHYWHRETRASMAEIDYLIQKEQKIIPIEVKSNLRRGLKSLALYKDQNPETDQGIHIYAGTFKKRKTYVSLPLYAVIKLFQIK